MTKLEIRISKYETNSKLKEEIPYSEKLGEVPHCSSENSVALPGLT
jgi:hypothetical protein